MTQRRFLILLFALAAGTRLFAAYWHYQDMNIDEVVSAYEAFSLAETGRDRTGAIWPLYFLNFGFGENVTYAYLLVPLFTFFGAQSFLTPIPSFVFNTLAVMMFYFWTRRMFSDSVARTASVLLAISPWHLILTSYEYNVALIPFLLFTGLWGFFVGIQDKKTWGFFVTVSCFVLAMYTYGIAMMLIPFELLTLLWFFRSKVRTFRVEFFLLILLGTALVLPLFLFMLTAEDGVVSLWPGSFPILGWTRASLFIPPGTPLNLALQQIAENFLAVFSLRPWFWNLDFYVAPPMLSLLWLWEAPLIVIGLMHAYRNRRQPAWRWVFWWSVVGLLPTLLITHEFNPHPWRLIMLLGIGELLAAQGLAVLYGAFKNTSLRRFGSVGAGVIILGSLLFFALRFTNPLPLSVYQFRQGGIAETMNILARVQQDTDRVVISDSEYRYYFFYLDVLWYERVSPAEFQRLYRDIADPIPGYFVPQIGKITFCYKARGCMIEEEYRKDPHGLWMVRGNELEHVPEFAKTVFPDGESVFRLIQTQP